MLSEPPGKSLKERNDEGGRQRIVKGAVTRPGRVDGEQGTRIVKAGPKEGGREVGATGGCKNWQHGLLWLWGHHL